jgi:hypothetical protein
MLVSKIQTYLSDKMHLKKVITINMLNWVFFVITFFGTFTTGLRNFRERFPKGYGAEKIVQCLFRTPNPKTQLSQNVSLVIKFFSKSTHPIKQDSIIF